MIRTTVAGNYPRIGDRPEQQKLRRAFTRRDRGEISEGDLRRIEDEVTEEVIREQVRAGIDLLTDGQVRWEDAQTYIAGRLRGVRISGLIRYFDTNTYYRQPVVEAPIRWKQPITVNDFRFASERSPRPVKPVLTGPFTLAKLSGDLHYNDEEALVQDFARALAEEIAALEEAGAEWIQIDEPAALWWPGEFPAVEKAVGILDRGRRKARLAFYTFFRGAGKILPYLDGLPVEALGVDLVEGREAADWIENSPPRQILALGILNARNTKLEDEAERVALVRRLRRASKTEDLFLNPNCGLEFLPREIACAKLELLSRIAARADQEGK